MQYNTGLEIYGKRKRARAPGSGTEYAELIKVNGNIFGLLLAGSETGDARVIEGKLPGGLCFIQLILGLFADAWHGMAKHAQTHLVCVHITFTNRIRFVRSQFG